MDDKTVSGKIILINGASSAGKTITFACSAKDT